MCVECEGGLEGWVSNDLDAAITTSHEEVVASPVEDALVGLNRLPMLGVNAKSCAVN